jgi:iron complex transport system substrate-binding protein
MRRSQLGVLLCSALVALWLIVTPGCGSDPASRSAQRDAAPPQRIVSISPSVTEILYGVGAWSQVIAVSQYCSYPDDVVNKPRVNGWGSINLEQVTALKPDLVIGVDAQEPLVGEKLGALGIRSMFLKSQNLAGILTAIREVGSAAGHEREAAELAEQIKTGIDEVSAKATGRSRPRVLCVVDRVPGTLRDMYVATRGSFLDELIGIAGGESIAPPTAYGYGYALITKEAILSLNPDVIIEMVQGSKGKFAENPGEVWRELAEVSAVRNSRIHSVRDPSAIHPSQFIGRTARLYAHYIHPEVFPDVPDKLQ